ncbi:MAG: ATP-binding protein [Deltaproteobacteria bacterium]
MKIEHKIYLSNSVHIVLLLLIGTFALHNLNQLYTKFRFITIADEMNAGFLEMRLAEKNYFLYGDEGALRDIGIRIDRTTATLHEVKHDIIRAVGAKNYASLERLVDKYSLMITTLSQQKRKDTDARNQLREVGQNLRIFSEDMTSLERANVEKIISRSKHILHFAFWAVVVFALFFSQQIVRNIGGSLRQIVELTRAISKGSFQPIDKKPSPDEMGAVVSAINTMAKELSKREKEILQSKRLASIGVLVAGVAHELNNPLNNISMIAQTYADVYDALSREERIDFMERIEEQTERLRLIIKNLLDFSRPKEPHLQQAEPNDVIQKTLDLVQNMLDVSNIRTKLDLAEVLPDFYIDEHQIQQVLVNITTNAIQAMGNGGQLTICSRYLEKDDEVEFEIRDTGKGIPPEFLEHIFDPFFTTKEEGGTGLGLWVSYGIVKQHHGNLRVESSVDSGTAFFITLPSCNKVKRCTNGQALYHGH